MSTTYLGKYYIVYIEPRLTLVLSTTCNAINIPPVEKMRPRHHSRNRE